MDSGQYKRFGVGNIAELHIAPRSKVVLSDLVERRDLPPIEIQKTTVPAIGNEIGQMPNF